MAPSLWSRKMGSPAPLPGPLPKCLLEPSPLPPPLPLSPYRCPESFLSSSVSLSLLFSSLISTRHAGTTIRQPKRGLVGGGARPGEVDVDLHDGDPDTQLLCPIQPHAPLGGLGQQFRSKQHILPPGRGKVAKLELQPSLSQPGKHLLLFPSEGHPLPANTPENREGSHPASWGASFCPDPCWEGLLA